MKMIARVTLAVITVLLFLAALAALTAAPAHAAEHQFKWEHFGADPYATSREEGMRTRESAFRKLGLPEDVIATFMIATDKPGEKIRIVNGDKLSAMLSKGGVVHKNVTVAFIKPPVNGKMEYAAPAEKWQTIVDGKTYSVFLPDVCNNWSAVIPTPLVPLTKISLKAPPVGTAACPNGYLLVANAWNLSSMPQGLRDTAMKLVNEAEERDSENASKMEAYKPSAFSRTLGGQLRREVKTRADVNTRITVNLRDPVSFRFIQTLGAMEMVNGIGKMLLTKDQVAMVVETIWPNGFVSPAISGGERRVELFDYEWGDRCEMNVHGAKLKLP